MNEVDEKLPLEYAKVEPKPDDGLFVPFMCFVRQVLFAVGVGIAAGAVACIFRNHVGVDVTGEIGWGTALIAFVMPLPRRWM